MKIIISTILALACMLGAVFQENADIYRPGFNVLADIYRPGVTLLADLYRPSIESSIVV
ncbi:hypothetical protein RGQ13_06080 [Thalassotalea psychrophila]|uniref:Uncharacterized protein n=1 Tax=Thalassotalea psychrophila TaxID=3065647 RepID=A0ABY9TXG8_9GAMM|nr:hypothetical protein RGQ13_06080 [Colwelliaceae bacterium SQ149]